MSIVLACVAIALWAVSLFNVGFRVGPDSVPWYGGKICMYGVLFGWAFGGWAAYANIWFVVAVARCIAGHVPGISSALMLILAATTPLFKGVPRDEATGVVLRVVAWGPGLTLWLIAMGVLMLAVFLQSASAVKPSERDRAP